MNLTSISNLLLNLQFDFLYFQEQNKKGLVTFDFVSELSKEQKRVLDAVSGKRNIFFTGSAGTGKSYLLRCILNSLPPDVTVATASTGAAACLVGGVTLHSFAGT